MPVSASAGLTVIVVCTPVCSPFPEKEIGARSVCCLVDIKRYFRLFASKDIKKSVKTLLLLKIPKRSHD